VTSTSNVQDRPGQMLGVRCSKPVRRPQHGDTLARVVGDYVKHCRARAHAERIHYAGLSLRDAVRLAGLAQTQDCRRFSHQRRIRRAVLRRSSELLVRGLANLKASRDFDDLYARIRATVGHLRGIGALTLYDTANRIAGRLKLEPTRVYLHAGTLDGARALGLSTDEEVLEMSAVPREFRRLRPREVEDAFCIFKERIARIRASRAAR